MFYNYFHVLSYSTLVNVAKRIWSKHTFITALKCKRGKRRVENLEFLPIAGHSPELAGLYFSWKSRT